MNYDFDLDMTTENSNSVIIKNVKGYSKVLEIGCAHGRMTKYLSENLNCKVTIVESNMKAGKSAAKYSYQSFIGVDGDVERKSFFEDLYYGGFLGYDYIIFADVLEHLHNPVEVLKDSKKVLSKNGSVLITLPNICHNSVIIDMWNNKFEYRDFGLLDSTHIKFFAESSLEKFADDAGFTISKKEYLRNAVENTEFNNKYSDVPMIVAEAMKDRYLADVYQFFLELKVK